jgi:hypothetical protein
MMGGDVLQYGWEMGIEDTDVPDIEGGDVDN